MNQEEKIISLENQLNLSNVNYNKLNRLYTALRKYNTKKCQEVAELKKELSQLKKDKEETIDNKIEKVVEWSSNDRSCITDMLDHYKSLLQSLGCIYDNSFLFNNIEDFRKFLLKYDSFIVDIFNQGVDTLNEFDKNHEDLDAEAVEQSRDDYISEIATSILKQESFVDLIVRNSQYDDCLKDIIKVLDGYVE